MKQILLALAIFICFIQMSHSQEQDGVVSLALPIRNSLTFNQYAINPTFSFVRQQNKYISITNKREWVQFEDAPQTYLASFSGRFSENSGIGIGLFQQNYGVLTTFGGIANFAYNARLARDSNLTFGMNVGAYKNGINRGNVVTNFPDPSLENIPSNFLMTINPGINYGTGFMDFGVSVNNLALLNTSELIEDTPQQSIQAHMMYTGYVYSNGFFDESRFTGLARSEFKKDKTVISGNLLLMVPKGIWAQVGYNNLFGASGGLGINITKQIAIEYNFEKALGDLTDFGPSHEITLAFKFNNNNNYDYSPEDDVSGLISGENKGKPVTVSKTSKLEADANRKLSAQAKAEAKLAAEAKAEADALAKSLADEKAKADAAAAKLAAEVKAKADLEAKEKLDAITKAKADEDAAKLTVENEARAKAEKIEADKRLKEVAEAKAKIAAENNAKNEAKLAAEAKAKLDAEAKVKADAIAKLDAETKAQAEAKAKADSEIARIAEEERIKTERLAQIELEAKNKAKVEEKAKAEAEATRLAEEAVLQAEAAQLKLAEENRVKEEAKAKADEIAEEERIETERLAQIELEAKNKIKATADAEKAAIEAAKPKDDIAQSMSTIEKLTEDSKVNQEELLSRFSEAVANKNKDLKDLKEENDLSDKGIVSAPKPFKSVTAENAAIEALKSDLEVAIKTNNERIQTLETLYEQRQNIATMQNDTVNLYYQRAIKKMKAEQLTAIQTKANLSSNLENIKVATEIERKRRIKRAAYDNEQDKYNQDRATLRLIKQNTKLSTVPLKAEDFDTGEEQSGNIQILKNIKNVESGYYTIVAVHDDVAKRDDFLTKAIASGRTDIDFFFDVSSSKYYIYYEKFDNIEAANDSLKLKGSRPYNGKLSIVKIEN